MPVVQNENATGLRGEGERTVTDCVRVLCFALLFLVVEFPLWLRHILTLRQ
jgi:hypothetical protein